MIATLLTVAVLPLALAQEPALVPASPSPAQGEALRIYLDCQPFVCDLDFLRSEITFVNYMRDRHDAQVYVLVTTQETGGGGSEYTLTFIGQGDVAGRTDTLRYHSSSNDTGDETRRGLARTLKLGLVRYIAGTPLARDIEVRYTPPAAAGAGTPRQQHDPWNYWVFSLGANGFFNGQKSLSSQSLSGNVGANRTTENWKISLNFSGNNSRSRFDLDSVTTFRSRNERYDFSALVVKSLGNHWSLGGRSSVGSSTFSNQKLRVRAGPALEYDVFPYAQSTRRYLTVRYSIGVDYAAYNDTTIFLRTEEAHPTHQLDATAEAHQPWGSASLTVSASQYLHDLSKKNVNFFANFDLRVVRGLFVNFFGNYSVVRDQLFLPKQGATQQQILVQQQQLATGYEYFAGVGLRYTFGSIYNNVVNPRFGGGGGTFFISN